MSRYIDADALIKRIQDEHKFGSLMLSNMIADMQTADVVEVVRCKDCENWDAPYCRVLDDAFDEKFFCALGERRKKD